MGWGNGGARRPGRREASKPVPRFEWQRGYVVQLRRLHVERLRGRLVGKASRALIALCDRASERAEVEHAQHLLLMALGRRALEEGEQQRE